MNRRSLLKSAAVALGAQRFGFVLIDGTRAQGVGPIWRHGICKFGELKYSAGFEKFDYVNAAAPKGGGTSVAVLGTFDNFNTALGGVKGALPFGIELIYNTLLVASLDEVASVYGLLAEAVSYPSDFSSATYRLRAEAKWHDGKSVTPEDVIFSFNTFKTLSQQAAATYRHVPRAEKTGDRDVTFTFDGTDKRGLPQIVGQLTILCKEWWEGTNTDGKKRSTSETTLEPPLGSGPYRIKEFDPGRSIIYERVADYWGKDLNVNIGRDNFGQFRFEYFRDASVALEAFKADTVDWRNENSAKSWATAYDFPAVRDKRVILEEFPIHNIGMMQAFAFNTRRDKFEDPRVRLAFNYLFNFEEMNKEIFFDQYKRTSSYFQGTDLASSGLPTGLELELLQSVRDNVSPELFEKPYTNPITNNQAEARNNLRNALRLFKEAGYEIRDQQLVNAKLGEQFAVELLGNSRGSERTFLFYKPSLERAGISVSVRSVDETQYQNRLRSWDFDIITYVWATPLLPGNEQLDYWGSRAADQPASENVIGIKNPAVDAMIEKIVVAKSPDELTAATRALDRVLLWNHYVVPQWSFNDLRAARWDRFGRPQTLPKYAVAGFPALWWWDVEKAANTGSRRAR